ncbi:MAG: molybdopterin-dependent oxidoreductase [Sterolibacterium sp.]|jgi:anaerobic selenocysteine-containing dehydrogenase|nr:molybdopterin-dependent oxidoreductase [Sterolibacterium sp.]
MSIEQRHSYCALCISRCGCIATLDEGVLTRVDADPAHPTGAALCVKAKAAPEAVYDPTRILQPLRRSRPKDGGDPGWQAISWDAALDLLAEKIRATIDRHGARGLALGVATPSGTAMADSFVWVHRLAHALKSPNLVFATENCNWHKDFAPALSWGNGIGMPDYAQTQCILLWGFNPANTWLAQATAVQQARKRGAKLIVIDPRRAGLAASADLWLRPRPGSDGALALGLAHLLITADQTDADFLEGWSDAPFLMTTEGRLLSAADLSPAGDPAQRLLWNLTTHAAEAAPAHPPNTQKSGQFALRGHFQVQGSHGIIACQPVFEHLATRCAQWTPAAVAAATGIEIADLHAAAALLAHHRPLSFFTWTGTCQHTNATQTGRAIAVLYALTGGLDAAGGNVWFDKPPIADMSGFAQVTPEEREQTLGLAERPQGPAQKGWITTRDLFRAVVAHEPYEVACLLSFGSNFLLSKPQTKLCHEALAQLDFFAITELHETPTARWADLLLPVCTAWEREGLQAGFQVSAQAESLVQLRPALVAPQGESRPDTWIIFELAHRLGLDDTFFKGNMEAGLRAQLAPTGLTAEQLRNSPAGISLTLPPRYQKYRQTGFATPSQRIELYCERLRDLGQDPLPDGQPIIQNAAPLLDLQLITAKWPQYCHSQQRTLPSLRRRMPEPLLEIHPETAQARGIAEHDWVEVHTALGSMRARARFDRHLAREVVCAQYGWWQFEDGAGDVNRILDGECFDPVAGSNSLRDTACCVSRAPAQETQIKIDSPPFGLSLSKPLD